MTVTFPPIRYLHLKHSVVLWKASTWKMQILVKMNCTFQKKQTMFILFTTELVIFILTQLSESSVCLLKGVLKRLIKNVQANWKKNFKIVVGLFILEKWQKTRQRGKICRNLSVFKECPEKDDFLLQPMQKCLAFFCNCQLECFQLELNSH